MSQRVLEISDRIDDILRSARTRHELVALLAILKGREVLIQEALTPAAAGSAVDGWMEPAEAAALLKLNVRTLYRAARRPPLSELAVWITPRRVRFNRAALYRLAGRNEPGR